MQIIDVYTKKEYECKKCKQKIYYGKIADDNGKLYTKDGLDPNGKFGKDSNVVSGAVDATVQDRLHSCTAHFVEKEIANAGKSKEESMLKTLWDVIDDKSEDMKELMEGLRGMRALAYEDAKVNHPDLSDQTNLFGTIVNANMTHLIQLAKIKAIKGIGGKNDSS